MSNELSITQYINQDVVRGNIEQTLGDKAPQFIASVASLVKNNPALANADKQSVMAACLTAAALDLPINQSLGFAYIIPYKEIAQLQIGWKGFVQLAQRSGQYKTINVTDVRQNEIVGKNRLSGEMLFEWVESDEARQKLPVIGYAGYFELLNGFTKTLYMTVEELKKHASRYSQSFKANSSRMNLWRDDFDVMAKKTVIKLLIAKYGPMTVDMQKAVIEDQSDGESYPDNQPLDHEQVSQDKENERVKRHIAAAKNVEELNQCEEALTDETRAIYNKKLEELNQ